MESAGPLSPSARNAIRTTFEDVSEVRAVYPFGSWASGQSNATSDLDLGIVTRGEDLPDKLDLLAQFVEQGIDQVDLVFLDRVDPVVRYEAVRPNVLVYRAETSDHGSYFSKVVRTYLDLKPLLARHRQAYKENLLRE